MPDGGAQRPREMFTARKVKRLVVEHDALWQERRDEVSLLAALYETGFWQWYDGQQKNAPKAPIFDRGNTRIEVNRLRKMVRTYLGALYPRASRVVCEEDPHGRGDAIITQATLNAWSKKPYTYLTVDNAAQMALTIHGSGLKFGHDAGRSSPIDRVWMRPIPPWEMMVDRDALSWEDERFRGHLYTAPIEDVLERFPQLEGMGLTGGRKQDYFNQTGAGGADPNKPETGDSTAADDGFVRVLEFLNLRDAWVYEDGTVIKGRLEVWILDQKAEISDQPIHCGPLPYDDADGRPLLNIEPLIFDHEIGYPFRALPPIKSAVPQQIELNLMRTAGAQDVRRNARKYGYVEGSVDEDELRKHANGVDGELIKFKPDVGDISRVLKPLDPAPIPADTIAHAAVAERDLDRQLGPSQNAQGNKIDTTAYEVQTIQLYAEEEIKYHATLLYGVLARGFRVVQAAIRMAGCHTGDSAGGSSAVVPEASGGADGAASGTKPEPEAVVAVAEGETDRGEPVAAVVVARAPEVAAFQPFIIMAGKNRLTVTAEALTGDFPITFVDAESTPVSRQTVLQFMTGPGFQQYMALWEVVQKGGPGALLAKLGMKHLAEAMNLPADMHPDAMSATLQSEADEEAKKTAKAKPSRAAQFAAGGRTPSDTEPPQPARSALEETLRAAQLHLSKMEGGEASAQAIDAALQAAGQGDRATFGAAMGEALNALPEGTPPEIVDALTKIANAIGRTAPAQGGPAEQTPAEEAPVSPLTDVDTPEVGSVRPG